MIKKLKDGTEYCELCKRKIDSRCRRCTIYKNKEVRNESVISKTDGESKKG